MWLLCVSIYLFIAVIACGQVKVKVVSENPKMSTIHHQVPPATQRNVHETRAAAVFNSPPVNWTSLSLLSNRSAFSTFTSAFNGTPIETRSPTSDLTPHTNCPSPVWQTGVNGSRGHDTGVRRRCPQVIIIGAKKAGTRALLEFLRVHPDVRAVGREVHFFDKNYFRGVEWYR